MSRYVTIKLTEREAGLVAQAMDYWAEPGDGHAYRDARRVAAKVRKALGSEPADLNPLAGPRTSGIHASAAPPREFDPHEC